MVVMSPNHIRIYRLHDQPELDYSPIIYQKDAPATYNEPCSALKIIIIS